MKKIFLIALVVLLAVSCGKLDVVGNGSIKSFEKMLDAMQDKTALIEEGWSLRSPDNSAWFVWGNHFIMLKFEAKPFLDAGLDTGKLPIIYEYDDNIMIYTEWYDTFPQKDSALASYAQIVRNKRDLIGYHAAADHYGISIGDGNMFEWAKNMSTNDKDIVFVLNPQPFIDAGVDPNNVEGWLFAKVTVDDENGRPIEVDKFLKPFNLR